MAQGTHIAAEIGFGRSVVHVDIMRIREQNFELAQRIVEARLLANTDMGFARGNCTPVDGTGGNLLAACIDLVTIAVEIARITHNLGQHLVQDDRARHAP